MRTIPILLLSLVTFGTAMAAPEVFTLPTERADAVFDRRSGALVALTDRETGRQWLAPDGGTRLYEVRLSGADGQPLALTLAQATGVKVRRTVEGVQVSADAHGEVALAVRVEFSADIQTGLLVGRLELKLPPRHLLQSVRFPVLSLPARIGAEAGDDRLLLPESDGLEIHNPEASLRGERALEYPGAASLQLLAAYDPQGGLLAAALDPEGHRKRLGFARVGESIEPIIAHFPALEFRSQWGLPYPVALGAIPGDWQAAANRYRDWAESQPWCRAPLWKRKDIPAWALQPAFRHTLSLRGELPGGQQGERLAAVAEHVAGYRKALGAPAVAMLTGWERQGAGAAPDAFPPVGGDAAFQALTGALREAGDRTLLNLPGLRWTLRRKVGGTDDNDEAGFRARGEKWAIVGEDGQVRRFGQPDSDTGEHALICPATPFARELLSEAVRRCQELGVDGAQVEQVLGGGMPPCCSKTHGHPPGGGNAPAQAVFRILDQLRREGKKRNRDFLLLMEQPGELFIPAVDGYHARESVGEQPSPHGAGARDVPLFAHVYHHHCLGFGGDAAPLSAAPDRFAAYQQALNLVHGRMPAGVAGTRWLPAGEIHIDQIEVLRNGLALLASPAGELLLRGRRIATDPVSTRSLVVRANLAGAPESEARTRPALLHAGYALPDGRVGRVFLNMGEEREQVEVAIPAYGMPGRRLRLTTYRVEGGKLTQDTEDVVPPTAYPLFLEPLSPVLLESAPGR